MPAISLAKPVAAKPSLEITNASSYWNRRLDYNLLGQPPVMDFSDTRTTGNRVERTRAPVSAL